MLLYPDPGDGIDPVVGMDGDVPDSAAGAARKGNDADRESRKVQCPPSQCDPRSATIREHRMWRRFLGSKIWAVIILAIGLVELVDLPLLARHVYPSITLPVAEVCGVLMLLCIPASRYKQWRNLVEQGYIRAAAPPRGKCHVCGYDLRGNVSGVCPECGTRVVKTPTPRHDFRDELRRHRSGDIPGIVIFSLLTIGGIILGIRGSGELSALGVVVALMSPAGVLMCVADLVWMKRR